MRHQDHLRCAAVGLPASSCGGATGPGAEGDSDLRPSEAQAIDVANNGDGRLDASLSFPNGIAFTASGDTAYVNDVVSSTGATNLNPIALRRIVLAR